jgi:multidrug resistance efflux pump
VKYGHVLQFDGNKSKGLYNLQDSLMRHNLLEKSEAVANSQLSILNSQLTQMETELKAIIQQYMERMTQDRLLP